MMAFIGPIFSILKWLTGGSSPFKNYALICLGMSLAVGGAYLWHRLDKRSAVRAAVVEYVAAAELAAKQAVVNELARRNVVANAAYANLSKQLDEAREAEAELDAELAAYILAQQAKEDEENGEPQAAVGVVGADILRLLRNN